MEAENAGRGKTMWEYNFGELALKFHFCTRSKVLFTKNQLNLDLSNRSIGLLKDIACNGNRQAPRLPKFA